MTGKGGVGKTTVAAALVHRAAAAGRRTLAVDVANGGDLAAAIASYTSDTAALMSHVEILGLTTQDSLNEYIRRFLKIPISPASIGPLSRIFDFVSNAAPAVKEILTVGKIGHEARHGGWDEIIVDAPSSGHVVELLAAPTSLHELIPSGPLLSQAAWLRELLAGPSTSVMVVATPEELPVTETETLLERLATETDVALGSLVINRAPLVVSPTGVAEAGRLAEALSADRQAATLALVAGVAVRRADAAGPFRSQLSAMADSRAMAVLAVAENFTDPVAAAISALAQADGELGR